MNYKTLLSLGLFSLFAQDKLKAQDTLRVYFAPGKSKLTQTSQQALDQFLKKTIAEQEYSLLLNAYTDDVGSEVYNQKLSKSRANAVWNYLSKQGLFPTKQTIDAQGELALKSEADVEAQRKENRRVDLVIAPFKPQNMEEIHQHWSRKDQTVHSFEGDKEQIVRGPEGTVIYVPANAFCYADGSPAKDVRLVLKEAYTYADMIRHQLSTESAQGLLETGGMIHLAALDQEGNHVQLRNGVSLDVRMPSQRSLPNGMKVFTSDRPANDFESTTVWKTEGEKVIRATQTPSAKQYKLDLGFYQGDTLDTLNFALEPLPSLINKFPIAPKKPQFAELKVKKLDLAEIKKRTPKAFLESKSKYNARVQEKFDDAQKKYEQSLVDNQTRKTRYEREMAQYRIDLEAYLLERENFESFLKDLDKKALALSNLNDSMQIHFENYKKFKAVIARNKRPFLLAKKYNLALEAHCDSFGLEKALADVKEMQGTIIPTGLDAHYKNIMEVNKVIHSKLMTDNLATSCRHLIFYMNKGVRGSTHDKLEQKGHFFAIYENTKKKAGRDEFMQAMRTFYEKYQLALKVQEHAELFEEIQFMYNQALEDLVKEDIIKQYEACKQQFNVLRKKIMDEKIDKGYLSIKDERKYFMNCLKINQLGWINCDRFLSYEEDMLVKVNLPYQEQHKVNFFVVLKKENVMIRLKKGSNGFVSGYKGIPKNAEVNLVGIQYKDDQTNFFEFKGKAAELNSLTMNFEPTSMRDIGDKLAALN